MNIASLLCNRLATKIVDNLQARRRRLLPPSGSSRLQRRELSVREYAGADYRSGS